MIYWLFLFELIKILLFLFFFSFFLKQGRDNYYGTRIFCAKLSSVFVTFSERLPTRLRTQTTCKCVRMKQLIIPPFRVTFPDSNSASPRESTYNKITNLLQTIWKFTRIVWRYRKIWMRIQDHRSGETSIAFEIHDSIDCGGKYTRSGFYLRIVHQLVRIACSNIFTSMENTEI